MTTITIPAKMSGTGTIYDIASEHYDREIQMGKSFQFAVLLPSYYGDHVTRHRTEAAAIAAYNKLSRDGYQGITILDRDGNEMIIHPGCNCDQLVKA